MATSGRKKAEKKPQVRVKRYEDGRYTKPSYTAATTTGGGTSRSAAVKKPAARAVAPIRKVVPDSAPASAFLREGGLSGKRRSKGDFPRQAPNKRTWMKPKWSGKT